MSRRKQLKPYHVLGEGESEATMSHNDTGGVDTLLAASDMTHLHGSCDVDGVRMSQVGPGHVGCPPDDTGVSHMTVNNITSSHPYSTHPSDGCSTGDITCRSTSVIQPPLSHQGDPGREGVRDMEGGVMGLSNGVVKEEPGLSRPWGAEMSPKSLALMRNICEYCGVVKKGPADLQRHLRKHTGERPFICQVCYKAFKAKRSLQYHEFAHHGIEPKDGRSSRHVASGFSKGQWPQKLSIAGGYGNNRNRIVTLDEAVALFTLSEMDKPGGPSRELNHKWLHLEAGGRSVRECSKSDSNNNDSLLSSGGNACVEDGVTSHKRVYDDTSCHVDTDTGSARDVKSEAESQGMTPKRLRQTSVVARRSSRLAAKQHTPPSNHDIYDMVHSNHHEQNGDAEKYYRCKVCAETFSSATSLAVHHQVSHDTLQMAPADTRSHQDPADVTDNKDSVTCKHASTTQCNMSSYEEQQLSERAPADGDADGRGNSTQQQGSSSSSSSSSSHRDSDLTQNTSPPNFASTGCCDDGSLPPGGSGEDNVVEYPSVFPGLKHRLSIKNETVLVTRLDGVDTTDGCQMSLFKCHMCGRMFRLLSRLQCHLSMHFERQLLLFQCTMCDSQFQFKMQLLQHMRSHGVSNTDSPNDTTDSPHTATAPGGQGLLTMVSPAVDGDVDPQPSQVTDTPMAAPDTHSEDQKDVSDSRWHDGGPSGLYTCRYCWKTFDRYFCLQRHERVHTGFKPCCCRHCGKGFSESRNLRQHMMRFHNDLNPALLIKRVRRKMSGSGLSRINQRLAYVTPEMIACAGDQPTNSDAISTGDPLYPQSFTSSADGSGEWGGDSSFVTPTRPTHQGFATPTGPTNQPPAVNHLASEIRKKESLGDDVTVVIPSDVPLDDVGVSPSRVDDRTLPWAKEDVGVTKEDSPDMKPSVSSSDEIMAAPVKSILAYSQIKSSKRKLLTPTRGPVSPDESPVSADMKTVDSWTPGSGGQPAVGLTSPVVTSSGVMDYTGHPMSAFSVSANAGSIPSVLPPHSDPLKAESTPPPLDSMSPSQFGLSFEDFDGEDDEMGWLGRAHARGTSLSRTHSRLNVVMSPLRRDEVCKPTVLPDGRTVYRCTYCNKDFTTLSDINRHMDFHEGEYKDIRPYKCRFCDYFARTNSQLKVHMMRHQGIREFHCRLCNYKGVTQSDLNRHTKSQIHVMKAQNVCDQCGEGFVSPKNLQQHYSEKHPALHQMAYSQGYNSL